MKKSTILLLMLSTSLLVGFKESNDTSSLLKVIATPSTPLKEVHNVRKKHEQLCLEDEETASRIETQIFAPLVKSVRLGQSINLGVLANFNVAESLSASTPKRTNDGISEYTWAPSSTVTFAKYFKEFKKLDHVEMKIVEHSVDPQHRNREGLPQIMSLRVQMDVRGTNIAGNSRHDKGVFRFRGVEKNGIWSVDQSSLLHGKTLVLNRGPAFKEVTKPSGLLGTTTYRRTEAIRRGGYALSVTDINNDGLQDIYVGMKGGAEIWFAQKDGSFTKAKGLPFEDEMYSKTAVFADFDNDGDQDVVITRFIVGGKSQKNESTPLDVVMYENREGVFVKKNKSFGLPNINREPMPSAVADFNNDGLLDFYVGYPGTQDFSQLGTLSSGNNSKRVQGLYLNDGKGGFLDTTETALDYANTAKFYGHLFPHSSMAVDIDQDQDMDLIVLDDRGNLSPTFENQGKGRFTESSKKIGTSNFGYAMSLAAGDVNNDGRVDLVYSNVNLTEIHRANSACERNFGIHLRNLDPGLRVFTANANGRFQDTTESTLLDDPGEATGGMTFLDYNNDGLQDIYVVNGLWSGTPDGQNLGSLFNWALIKSKAAMLYSLRNTDSIRFMDILSTFKGTITNYTDANTIKKDSSRPSLGGFQRNRLYRNNGDGTYTDVAYLEGVDSIADGYIVAKGDMNNDGKMDLVLRNADPGTDDYRFPVVQMFQNTYPGQGKSVSLTFSSRASNRDAIGVFAKAYYGDQVQVQHVVGNSGSAQDQRVMHFGLGKNKKISKLEVFWPSGSKETFKNLQPGTYKINESQANIGSIIRTSNTVM